MILFVWGKAFENFVDSWNERFKLLPFSEFRSFLMKIENLILGENQKILMRIKGNLDKLCSQTHPLDWFCSIRKFQLCYILDSKVLTCLTNDSVDIVY